MSPHTDAGALLKLAEWQEARKAFLAVDHASPKDFDARKPLFDRLADAEGALMKVEAASQGSAGGERSEVRTTEPDVEAIARSIAPYTGAIHIVCGEVASYYSGFNLSEFARRLLASRPVAQGSKGQIAFINARLEDLAESNAIYGKDQRLGAPGKIARNDREISWLKDLRSMIVLASSVPSAQLGGPRCTCARADVNLSQSVPHAPGCPMGDR